MTKSLSSARNYLQPAVDRLKWNLFQTRREKHHLNLGDLLGQTTLKDKMAGQIPV